MGVASYALAIVRASSQVPQRTSAWVLDWENSRHLATPPLVHFAMKPVAAWHVISFYPCNFCELYYSFKIFRILITRLILHNRRPFSRLETTLLDGIICLETRLLEHLRTRLSQDEITEFLSKTALKNYKNMQNILLDECYLLFDEYLQEKHLFRSWNCAEK